MCDLKQPKPISGPTLCKAGQELIVRCLAQGDRNNVIRKALQKDGHYHDLSDAAFTPYRKLSVVKEARRTALAALRDVGVASLSRRIDVLEAGTAQLFQTARSTKDNREAATAFRAALAGCRELSRLVDVPDADEMPSSANAGEGNATALLSIEQIRTAFGALTPITP